MVGRRRPVRLLSPVLLAGLLLALGCGGETPRPREAGLASPGLQPLSNPVTGSPTAESRERLAPVQGLGLCALVQSEPAEAERAAYASVSVFLVPQVDGALTRALRKPFPQAKVLLVRDLRPSAEAAAVPVSEADPTWLARAGSEVGGIPTQGEARFDLSSPSAREGLAAALTRQLQDSAADGLYLQGVALTPAPPVANEAAEGAQSLLVLGARELLGALRKSAPQASLIVEADLSDLDRMLLLVPEMDGLALRVQVGWDAKAGGKWLTGLWNGVSKAAEALAKGKRHLLLVPAWPEAESGKPQQSEGAVRQLMALYLLTWSERARVCIDPALLASAGMDSAMGLGAPAGKSQEKDGVLSREFPKARAFLNLNGKEAPLPKVEGMVDLSGGAPPTSLAGCGALILVPPAESA